MSDEFVTLTLLQTNNEHFREWFNPAPTALKLAIINYFPVLEWGNAAHVSYLESHWIQNAVCHDCFVTDGQGLYSPKGAPGTEDWAVVPEHSQGMFQVNTVPHDWARELDLFDIETNVRAARVIFDWQGWDAWRLSAAKIGI